ncbi:MAG: hypothetical protein ACI9CZ_000969 [Flavobacterium sp.]|jgi:hypothetical protein
MSLMKNFGFASTQFYQPILTMQETTANIRLKRFANSLELPFLIVFSLRRKHTISKLPNG